MKKNKNWWHDIRKQNVSGICCLRWNQGLIHSFLLLLFLHLILPVKVASVITRAASSFESIYNVKNTDLFLKHIVLAFENKIILFLSYIFLIAFIQNQKWYEKWQLCLCYTFPIFFIQKESMTNHIWLIM